MPKFQPSKVLNRHRFAYIKRSFKLKRNGEENDLELEKLQNKIMEKEKKERKKIIEKEVDRDSRGVIDEFIGDNTEVVEV